MHAVAGLVDERFRHEARKKIMLAGNGADQVTQHDGVIARADDVVLMLQIDLVLSRREFGRCTRCGNALRRGRLVDVFQQRHEAIELSDAVDLVRRLAVAGCRIDRRLRPAFAVHILVENVEFEFAGDRRRKADIGKTLRDTGENVTRFERMRIAVIVEHGHQHLRLLHRCPGHGHDRAGNRMRLKVWISVGESHPEHVFIDARHIEEIERLRHLHAAGEDLVGFLRREALAANGPAHIYKDRVEIVDVALFGEEGIEFAQRGPALWALSFPVAHDVLHVWYAQSMPMKPLHSHSKPLSRPISP